MTSRGLIDEISDEFLVCRICSGRYERPRSLACLHTFCEECLEIRYAIEEQERPHRFLQARSLSCPLCGAKTDLPPGGVRRLPANAVVTNLADVVGRRRGAVRTPACEICSVTASGGRRVVTASVKCLECAKTLCAKCAELHRRTKVTSAHSLYDVHSEHDVECRVHPSEAVRFYCEPCRACVCVLCTFHDHADHTILTFQECLERHVRPAAESVKSCRLRAADLRAQFCAVQRAEGDLKRAEEAIRDATIEAVTALRRRERTLVAELRGVYGEEAMEVIGRGGNGLGDRLRATEETCELVERLLGKGKGVEFLIVKDELGAKLTSLLETELAPLPRTLFTAVEFVRSDGEAPETLGRLVARTCGAADEKGVKVEEKDSVEQSAVNSCDVSSVIGKTLEQGTELNTCDSSIEFPSVDMLSEPGRSVASSSKIKHNNISVESKREAINAAVLENGSSTLILEGPCLEYPAYNSSLGSRSILNPRHDAYHDDVTNRVTPRVMSDTQSGYVSWSERSSLSAEPPTPTRAKNTLVFDAEAYHSFQREVAAYTPPLMVRRRTQTDRPSLTDTSTETLPAPTATQQTNTDTVDTADRSTLTAGHTTVERTTHTVGLVALRDQETATSPPALVHAGTVTERTRTRAGTTQCGGWGEQASKSTMTRKCLMLERETNTATVATFDCEVTARMLGEERGTSTAVVITADSGTGPDGGAGVVYSGGMVENLNSNSAQLRRLLEKKDEKVINGINGDLNQTPLEPDNTYYAANPTCSNNNTDAQTEKCDFTVSKELAFSSREDEMNYGFQYFDKLDDACIVRYVEARFGSVPALLLVKSSVEDVCEKQGMREKPETRLQLGEGKQCQVAGGPVRLTLHSEYSQLEDALDAAVSCRSTELMPGCSPLGRVDVGNRDTDSAVNHSPEEGVSWGGGGGKEEGTQANRVRALLSAGTNVETISGGGFDTQRREGDGETMVDLLTINTAGDNWEQMPDGSAVSTKKTITDCSQTVNSLDPSSQTAGQPMQDASAAAQLEEKTACAVESWNINGDEGKFLHSFEINGCGGDLISNPVPSAPISEGSPCSHPSADAASSPAPIYSSVAASNHPDVLSLNPPPVSTHLSLGVALLTGLQTVQQRSTEACMQEGRDRDRQHDSSLQLTQQTPSLTAQYAVVHASNNASASRQAHQYPLESEDASTRLANASMTSDAMTSRDAQVTCSNVALLLALLRQLVDMAAAMKKANELSDRTEQLLKQVCSAVGSILTNPALHQGREQDTDSGVGPSERSGKVNNPKLTLTLEKESSLTNQETENCLNNGQRITKQAAHRTNAVAMVDSDCKNKELIPAERPPYSRVSSSTSASLSEYDAGLKPPESSEDFEFLTPPSSPCSTSITADRATSPIPPFRASIMRDSFTEHTQITLATLGTNTPRVFRVDVGVETRRVVQADSATLTPRLSVIDRSVGTPPVLRLHKNVATLEHVMLDKATSTLVDVAAAYLQGAARPPPPSVSRGTCTALPLTADQTTLVRAADLGGTTDRGASPLGPRCADKAVMATKGEALEPRDVYQGAGRLRPARLLRPFVDSGVKKLDCISESTERVEEGEEGEGEEVESSGKDPPVIMLQKGDVALPPAAPLRGCFPGMVARNGIIPGGGSVEGAGGRFFPPRRLERLTLAPPNSPRAVKPSLPGAQRFSFDGSGMSAPARAAEGFVRTRSRLDAATGKIIVAAKSREGGVVGSESNRVLGVSKGALSAPLSECEEG